MSNLREEVQRHDRLYRAGTPEISDAEYDELFARLKAEQGGELPLGDRPAEGVRHLYPMLSLDNVFNSKDLSLRKSLFDECAESVPGIEWVVEPKIDGVALSLRYMEGLLVSAALRGNGEIGENVIEIACKIEGIPQVLTPHLNAEIRGEVVMHKQDFAELVKACEERGERAYANPRNIVAGTLRMKGEYPQERKLRFVAYSLLQDSQERQTKVLADLRSLGFTTPSPTFWSSSWEDVVKYLKGFEKKRDSLEYEIDGLVVKVNEPQHQEWLGNTARAPKWAFAWKFASRKKTALIEQIVHQVGRTGAITPVAKVSPVSIGGVTIKSVTLHNPAQVLALGEGLGLKPGDLVEVARAGDVIPEITRLVHRSLNSEASPEASPYSPPTHCPCCKSVLAGGPTSLTCVSNWCSDKFVAQLVHFASRDAMNIEGFGPTAAEEAVKWGVDDLYELFSADYLAHCGTKLAEAIRGSVASVKGAPAVFALGIPGIGKVASKLLAKVWTNLTDSHPICYRGVLVKTGLPPSQVAAVENWLGSDTNFEAMRRLEDAGVVFQEPEASNDGVLKGKVICITGTLSIPRAQMEKRLSSAGAEVVDSVTARTTILVYGDKAGSKLAKAQKLGVQTMTEAEVTALLGDL